VHIIDIYVEGIAWNYCMLSFPENYAHIIDIYVEGIAWKPLRNAKPVLTFCSRLESMMMKGDFMARENTMEILSSPGKLRFRLKCFFCNR
jgi:hypothetical protein